MVNLPSGGGLNIAIAACFVNLASEAVDNRRPKPLEKRRSPAIVTSRDLG
jgi:hypothetical protein